MHDLKTIIKLNDDAVRNFKAKAKGVETNHNRECSMTGDAESGIVIHSAKCRETRFIPAGAAAKTFLFRYGRARSQAARNYIIEAHFSK